MPGVLAHAPLDTGDNESLNTATVIPDPTKSWAIYAELHEGGEAQYYRFDIGEGQRIHIMLFKSTRFEEAAFLPSFVLMGPGIIEQGDFPDYVEKPSDAEAFIARGQLPSEVTFEPFSPSSFYSLAEISLNAPVSGTYYIAVYEPSTGGHYGLAVGDRESYALDEWILIPFNLISIYQWEGQSLALIFAPMLVTLAIGIGLIIWQNKKREALGTIIGWLGAIAGLLFISTGAITFFQLGFSLIHAPLVSEAVITVVFALIPILLGIGAIRLCWSGIANLRRRIYLAVIGIGALFAWAGLLIGPALAIIASAMPSRSNTNKAQIGSDTL